MSLSRLVLFDIDGTLLHAGRSWRNCFEESLRLEFPTAEFPQISFGGKTDPQICRELLCNLIDDTDLLDQIVNRVLMNYVERLETNITTIRNDLILLPCVRAALEHLSDVKGVELGVLTGNLARLKN